MLKVVVVTALFSLSISLPLGLITFAVAGFCLKRGGRFSQIVFQLILAALILGMAYGVLRFAGVILFPEDNTMSVNWFDASWRDDGFRYIYGCGTFAAGIAAALHAEKKNLMMKE